MRGSRGLLRRVVARAPPPEKGFGGVEAAARVTYDLSRMVGSSPLRRRRTFA